MKFILTLFTFILWLHSSNIQAQKRYIYQFYNTTNGLANNNIMTINQDRNGYIYFGTDVGLTKFDGFKFDNNVIPILSENTAFVEDIENDPEGNLVVTGFMQGIFIQQPDGSFKQYLAEKPQIGKNVTKSLKVISKNKILVSVGRRMYLFQDEKFKILYDNKDNRIGISTMEYDPAGNIWFGGYYGLAVIPSGDSTYTPYFLPELKGKYINKILFDSDGNLLVGTIQGFYKVVFNVRTNYLKGYKVACAVPVLKDAFINNIYIDRLKNLWIATTSNGVFKIKNNQVVENITTDNGFPSNSVMRTFQDNEGNYWFTFTIGAIKIADFNRYSFAYEGKILTDASGFIKDDFGRIFLYNKAAIFTIEGNKVKKFDTEFSPVKTDGIKFFCINKNTAWVLNYNGLYSMSVDSKDPDLRKLKLRADLKKADISRIRCMDIDKNDNIWIGTDKALYVFHNNKLICSKINYEKASKIKCVKIIQDTYGYYWIGDFSIGLFRLKLSKLTNDEVIFDSVLAYKSLKSDSAFVNAWIQDLMVDHEGYLWQSSLYTGVYRLKLNQKGVVEAKLFSQKNGLSNNQVSTVVEDNKHHIWFLSLSGADCYDPKTDRFVHYNKKDGLGNQVYSILSDSSRLYLEYEEGIMVIDDIKKDHKNELLPKVLITNVSVNGNTDSLALSGMTMHYRYNQNFISFDFTSVSFRYDDVAEFQYILEGVNKTWSNYTENRNISYSNLSPGRYRFMVRAKNPDGLLSKEYAQFPFVILPPFYKTWWFILLSVSVFITLVYFAYQYRIKQLLKVERLRTRIASDLHDDVGSTLSSISILSEILSSQLDNNPKSAEMIGKIGTNARNMLESMDDIIWAVNPSNDKFQNLGLRIREYAIPLFESKNIEFKIHFSEKLALLPLPMDIRRNVYLICKEAINNMVKYSGCTLASIDFQETQSYMIMTVSDNGIGFETHEPTSRNGLKNMQRRATQIKAEIVIESMPGNGTKIRLEVKII